MIYTQKCWLILFKVILTRKVQRSIFVFFSSRKSINLPGVAMHISTPRSRSLRCGCLDAPPYTHVFLIPNGLQNVVATPCNHHCHTVNMSSNEILTCTCWANSLVGANTKHYNNTTCLIQCVCVHARAQLTMGPSPWRTGAWCLIWTIAGNRYCNTMINTKYHMYY